MIESKKKKLLTLDVHKSLVWELMEGWGQLSQERGWGVRGGEGELSKQRK